MQKQDTYISNWRIQVEKSLNWGDSMLWTDNDFEKLGELILKKTNTLLSVSTLKRLWGRVKYDSSPNAATLNTMAKFAGFDDWRAFKHHTDSNEPVTTQPAITFKKNKYIPLSLAIAVIALGGLLAWNLKPKHPEKGAVKFESKKVSEDLPNSVVFNYDVSALHTDSVTLQQSWDPSRNERIAADGKQHTSIYYEPGYFSAKLITNGQVIKESPVFIKTKGWIGLIEKRPTPTYLSEAEIHLPGALGLTNKTLIRKTGSPVFNDQWVSFYNVRDFGHLSGGNFTLETTLRNTSMPDEASCRKVMLYILGKQNAIIIPLADKGCISALDLYTSSEWIKGKDKDLSTFGCNFNNFQKLKCSVKNMKLQVYLNDNPILATPITQTIDEVVGLCISFEGPGEIKEIKLGDDNKTVLHDVFNHSVTSN